MNILLRRSMDRLRQRVLRLGGCVQDQVDLASDAVLQQRAGDLVLARAEQSRVAGLEQEIEEECLHILALHQPVAFDLRMLVSMLKMNAQLVRIDDLAVNLVQQAELLSEKPAPKRPPFDLDTMSVTTREMLRLALDAVIDLDADLAGRVREMDDVVDAIHRGMYPAVTAAIRRSPEQGAGLILMISVSRQFERIADYARAIAKDVQYLACGEIVRHAKLAPVDAPRVDPSPTSRRVSDRIVRRLDASPASSRLL